VEWKITDVRYEVVRRLPLIMASNSYSCMKELHCGGAEIYGPYCVDSHSPAVLQCCHHLTRDTGADLAVEFRTVKCVLNTQNLLTDCHIQTQFGDFTSVNLPHTNKILITSEFNDLKNSGNPIKKC
jgi:hypothetical protein